MHNRDGSHTKRRSLSVGRFVPVHAVAPPGQSLAELPLTSLPEALGDTFGLRREPVQHRVYTCWDAFDWPLYNQGLLLVSRPWVNDRTEVRIQFPAVHRPIYRLVVREVPQFASDWPDDAFRSTVFDAVGPRALVPVAEVRCRVRALRLLNRNQKTVACVEQIDRCTVRDPASAQSEALPPCVRLLPVRGYPKAFHKAYTLLREDSRWAPAAPSLLHTALTTLGQPKPPSTPPCYDWPDRNERADHALKRVLSAMLQDVRTHAIGLRLNQPTALASYRAAVEQTLMILRTFKGVFRSKVSKTFRADFQWIDDLTMPVYTLGAGVRYVRAYQRHVSSADQAALEAVTSWLYQRLRREHVLLIESLDQPRYTGIIDGWHRFLETPERRFARAPDAARPIYTVATERMVRLYRKVQAASSTLPPSASLEALHPINEMCRTLHLLTVVLDGLHPDLALPEPIPLIHAWPGHAPSLTYDEAHALTYHAAHLEPALPQSLRTLPALQRLLADLTLRQQHLGRRFAPPLARFCRPSVHDAMNALLASD